MGDRIAIAGNDGTQSSEIAIQRGGGVEQGDKAFDSQ